MPKERETCTLLAMAPAGEAVLIEDDRHRIWLISLTRHYHQRQASRDDVDVAVNKYGWEPVGRTFASWPDLDNYRLRRASEGLDNLPDPQVADYDRGDVEVILKQVARSGPQRRAAAEALLTDLALRCGTVRTDDALAAKVADQLDALRRQPRYRVRLSKYADDFERMDLDYGLAA